MTAALQTPSLPPEALALIKEGTPRPQTQTPIISVTPTSVKAPEASAPKTTSQGHLPRPKTSKNTREEPGLLVSMNFRVPASLPQALLKASSERKMTKVRPYTQQDIITEALTEWLRKNGYMPE